MSVCMSVCMSVYLSVCLSIYLSVYLFGCLLNSVNYGSFCLYVYTCHLRLSSFILFYFFFAFQLRVGHYLSFLSSHISLRHSSMYSYFIIFIWISFSSLFSTLSGSPVNNTSLITIIFYMLLLCVFLYSCWILRWTLCGVKKC
jgi:hypothetical protein